MCRVFVEIKILRDFIDRRSRPRSEKNSEISELMQLARNSLPFSSSEMIKISFVKKSAQSFIRSIVP